MTTADVRDIVEPFAVCRNTTAAEIPGKFVSAEMRVVCQLRKRKTVASRC